MCWTPFVIYVAHLLTFLAVPLHTVLMFCFSKPFCRRSTLATCNTNLLPKDMDTSTIPTCPWCRCEIKGTESVVIEPYKVEEALSETENTIEDLKIQ